jgi:putative endonuclease
MHDHIYFVYLLASKKYGTLYIGVTNDLVRRIAEHKEGGVPGFTKKYEVNRLVWFERHGDISFAIEQEERLKRWRGYWKIRLNEEDNPLWLDLYPTLLDHGSRTGPLVRPG